jgi:subtilase family serine protease
VTLSAAQAVTATFGVTTQNYPDLVTVSVSDPPVEIAAGKIFTVAETALNQGTVASASSTSRYYLSVDGAKDASDILLHNGVRGVPTLAPGATSAHSRTITVPASTPEGTYVVLVCADDYLGVVEGPGEANNCLASAMPVIVRLPDLVTVAVGNPPAAVTAGGTLTATDTVQNVGAIGSGSTYTRYYLSPDGTKGAGILLTGTRGNGPLAVGASASGSKTVTIPGTMPAGVYYLVACADDTNLNVERDELNNCRASTTTTSIP